MVVLNTLSSTLILSSSPSAIFPRETPRSTFFGFFWLKYKPPLVTVFNKVEGACKIMYMNKGLVEPVRRVKLWAPGFPGAHFDGVKEGCHELCLMPKRRGGRDSPVNTICCREDLLHGQVFADEGSIWAGPCLSLRSGVHERGPGCE